MPASGIQVLSRSIAILRALEGQTTGLSLSQLAQRTGLPLARARRRGAYARALSRLLDELFLQVAPAPRGRKLRLLPPRAKTKQQERVAVP